MFISYLCYAITYSKYLPFADDIKIYRAIKSPQGYNLLQSDINCTQGWCTAKYEYMKLNINETKVIFSGKTNILIYDYKLRLSSTTRTDFIKDLGIFLYSKLNFHNHVNRVYSHCIKLLGVVRSITFTFSSLECML
jgi:hypothetical protein